MDYSNKINLINKRYNPNNDYLVERRAYSSISGEAKDVGKYVLSAMREVDDEYTKKTKEAGNAVREQLKAKIADIEFEYQGSVMTDTHIRGASDIDLLTITTKFYNSVINKVREEKNKLNIYSYEQICRLQNYDRYFSAYKGDSNADLRKLRADNEKVLSEIYNDCDTSKSKSIKITNHHYHRDVDIVTSCWHDSLDYILNGCQKEYRGIKIYDKDNDYAIGPDYPFLSISRIYQRSALTNGKLKRMIRFLKNVRTDADKKIELTSFDINAICYDIPIIEYQYRDYKEIVNMLWSKMYHLLKDGTADNLKSVIGTEYIFRNKPQKVEALKILEDEVWKINSDLK